MINRAKVFNYIFFIKNYRQINNNQYFSTFNIWKNEKKGKIIELTKIDPKKVRGTTPGNSI